MKDLTNIYLIRDLIIFREEGREGEKSKGRGIEEERKRRHWRGR